MKAMLLTAMIAGCTASHAAASAAAPVAPAGSRTVEMSVTEKGFEPAHIEVKKGEPLHLVVTRRTERTCARELVIKDQDLRKELPLNEAVSFDFTPSKTGEMGYACGMDMIRGVLVVR
jgi:plastocyanin domain-containing protein